MVRLGEKFGKKNNKGFSLVELIIVIAIMVALIAVMGPQYIKYVQSSRDAVVIQAAQDVLSMVKAEVSMGHIGFTNEAAGTGTVIVKVENGNGIIRVSLDGLTFNDNGNTDFESVCGVDTTKTVKSNLIYKINVTGNNISSHPELVEIEVETTHEDD